MSHAIPIKRPLWRRLLRGLWKKVLCGLGALLIIHGVMAWRYYTGAPTIARNVAAEINARIEQVPLQDRAWPLYVEALSRLERLKPNLDVDTENDLARVWQDLRPGNELWPQLVAYLDRNAEVIAMIRAASDKPAMGWLLYDTLTADAVRTGDVTQEQLRPPSANPRGLDLLLGHLGHSRRMARMLVADARLAAERGNGRQAAEDVAAAIGIADQLLEHRTPLLSLVSFSVLEGASQAAIDLTAGSPGVMGDSDLAMLGDRFRNYAGGGRVHVATEDETLFFEDLLQRTFTDDGAGDGRITPEGWEYLGSVGSSQQPRQLADWLVEPFLVTLVVGRKESLWTWNELMAGWAMDSETPPWQLQEFRSVAKFDALKAQLASSRSHLLVGVMAPAFTKLYSAEYQVSQNRDAALVGIALERYRLRAGRYPAVLADLVPSLLTEVPVDRMDGQPFRYVVQKSGPIVYSVGADTDDDGGVPPTGRDSLVRARYWQPPSRRDSTSDGDWILWPWPDQSQLESDEP